MSELLSTSTLVSVIIEMAAGVFHKKITDSTVNKKKLESEVKNAISNAVDKTAGDFRKCFYREKGSLDEYYWQRDEVIEQLWEGLTDIKNTESIPDFNILYEAYSDVYRSEVRIDRGLFDKTLEEFWLHFLEEAKGSKILAQFYLNKIIFQLDETVYPLEGRRMIREYCERMIKKLEEKIYKKFRPSELEESCSLQEIKREFFDYKQTQMAYFS